MTLNADTNAYILDWTMNDYEALKRELVEAGFKIAAEADSPDIRVSVPLEQLEKFAVITQSHLNAPFNYIDIQYPEDKLTVIVFVDNLCRIKTDEQNARIKAWAIARGLPPAQADWPTSY